MTRNEIWQAIEAETKKSRKRHPSWPDHIAAQAGIVTGRAGKLINGCMDRKYRKDDPVAQDERIKAEAIKLIVATIRFLENRK